MERTRGRIALAVAGCVAALTGCSSSSSHTASTQPAATSTTVARSATTTLKAPTTPDPQVWLCKPGKPENPCLSSLTTTVVAPDGSKTIAKAAAATDPKIDCFYVYPTVSPQPTVNANLKIDDAEIGVATAQAARYSQVCRVFAPMYRQVTLSGLFKGDPNASGIAFRGVVTAWKDYLARYNKGRGVVLIGHSQGTFILRQLIAKYVDPFAAVRRQVVSAILLGGNVTVQTGKDVGGDFASLPACRNASQIGCVIAFSSFDHTPPPGSLFGRARKAGKQVLCTNPAALAGGSGPLEPYLPTHLGRPQSATKLPPAATLWNAYPNLFTARCESSGGASWLQINDMRKAGDNRPALADSLGPEWGLHLYDGQIALGNLVDIVRSQAAAYAAKG